MGVEIILDRENLSKEIAMQGAYISQVRERLFPNWELEVITYNNLVDTKKYLDQAAGSLMFTDLPTGYIEAKINLEYAQNLLRILIGNRNPIINNDEWNTIASVKSKIPQFIYDIDTESLRLSDEEIPTENYDMEKTKKTNDSITSTQDNLSTSLGSNPKVISENKATIAKEQAEIDNLQGQLDYNAGDLTAEEETALEEQIAELEANKTPEIKTDSGFAAKLNSVTGVDGGLLQKAVSDSLGSFKIAGIGADKLLGDTTKELDNLLGPIDKNINAVTGILGGASSVCSGLDSLKSIGDSIGGAFDGAKSFLDKGISGLTGGLGGIGKGIGSALGGIGDAISDPLGSLKKAGKGIASGISGAASLIGKGLSGAGGFLSYGLGDIGKGISGALSDPIGAFSNVMGGIGKIVGKLPGMTKDCGIAKARCVSSHIGALGPRINPKIKTKKAACGEELEGALGGVANKLKGVADFLNNAEANLNNKVIGMAKGVIGDFAGDSGIGNVLGDAAKDMLANTVEETSANVAAALPSGIGGTVVEVEGGGTEVEGPAEVAGKLTESIMSCRGVNEISLTATIENARIKILEYIANIEDHPDTLPRDLKYLPKVRNDINDNYYLKPAGNLQARMSTTRFHLAYSVYVTNLFNGITKEDIDHYSQYQYIIDNVNIIKQTRDDLANYLQTQIGLCTMTEVEKKDKLAADLKSNLSVVT